MKSPNKLFIFNRALNKSIYISSAFSPFTFTNLTKYKNTLCFSHELVPKIRSSNSLLPWRCDCNLKSIIFKSISRICILNIACEIALMWMPKDSNDDKSTLVQEMDSCREATQHYLNQCWPCTVTPHSVTRLQWASSHFSVRVMSW